MVDLIELHVSLVGSFDTQALQGVMVQLVHENAHKASGAIQTQGRRSCNIKEDDMTWNALRMVYGQEQRSRAT